mgnify:CR=1 FL=1
MNVRTRKIQRVGNSSGILLPKEWLDQMGLKPGAVVHLQISGSKITILPSTRHREVKVDSKFARQVDDFLERNKALLERLS